MPRETRRRRRLLTLLLLMIASATTIGTGAYRFRYEELPSGVDVDYVLLEKTDRRLSVYHDGKVLKTYRVALGTEPLGPKRFEGDGRTPEGYYSVNGRKSDACRTPHQVEAARVEGRSAGGDIMIHGLPNGLGFIGPLHRLSDWTRGCIAVTNAEIDELWAAIPEGTPVEIRP